MIFQKIIEKYKQNGPKGVYRLFYNLHKAMRYRYKIEGWYGACQEYGRQINPEDLPQKAPVEIALEVVLSKKGFTIIQIGAYIGNSENDSLFQQVNKRLNEIEGKIILIEPVKAFYEKLKENYRDVPNAYFENVAISDTAGEFSFFRLGVDPIEYGYPEFLSQLGSLKAERMEELWDNYENIPHLKEFYLKYRVEDKVTCMTLADIIKKHDIREVDLLQIDVEGYEYEILSSINYKDVPIRFINYESVLLQKHKWDAYNLLKKNGYIQADYSQDTFAYRPADAKLKTKWMNS